MDLIAVVTDEENLDVYRLNGQLAFSLKRKSEDVTVDALQWEFNGKSIAVSWSDGSTDLVNAETGKVAHKDLMLPTPTGAEDAPSRVKCIGWGLNFIDVDAVKRRTGVQKASGESDAFGQPTTEDWDAFKDDTTIEDFLQRQPDFQSLDVAPDLPDQLAMMDVEVLLPKLPAIPLPPALPFMRVSQADSGAFSSQADVDALLHSSHLRDHNSVDMFIRCSDRGTVHPSMYDSKETVNIHLPTAWGVESIPLLHTSHPYNCSHGLLMRTTLPTSGSKIAFVPLTLNFIPSAGIYLHLIASKTSQLQNLLLYITQCLQRIRTFFKHANDLPSKFMMNISETLEEKDMGNLVTNLFHIACTGNCPPLIKEWLVDELTEAGHKRWDAAVTTSLTTLLAIVHENLIPAIDRCSIIISRLRGLAEFHQDRDWIFTCALSDFSNTLDVLKCMRLLAHTVLLYAAEEKRQFNQFSKWLRFVIDFEATEPESQSRQEMETRDSGTDVMQVLEYIQFGLTNSELKPYLKPAEGKGKSESYEDTKKAVEVLKEGGGYKEDAVCLENVLGYFKESVTGLLRQVSLWQEGNIRMDGGIVLEDATTDDAVVDMRMVFEVSFPFPSPFPRLINTNLLSALILLQRYNNIHRHLSDPIIPNSPHPPHNPFALPILPRKRHIVIRRFNTLFPTQLSHPRRQIRLGFGLDRYSGNTITITNMHQHHRSRETTSNPNHTLHPLHYLRVPTPPILPTNPHPCNPLTHRLPHTSLLTRYHLPHSGIDRSTHAPHLRRTLYAAEDDCQWKEGEESGCGVGE